MSVLSPITKRLAASLQCDVINGSTDERLVFESQVREALTKLHEQESENAALRARLAFYEREWKPEDVTDQEGIDCPFDSDVNMAQAKIIYAVAWNRLVQKSKEPK